MYQLLACHQTFKILDVYLEIYRSDLLMLDTTNEMENQLCMCM